MRNHRHNIITYISCIWLFLLVGCSLSYAGSINIEPVRLELSGRPGEVVEGRYSINNPNDYEMRVAVEFRRWGQFVQNEDIKAEDWLKLESMSVELKPKETRKLGYTINIPKKAVGELMTMVYFKTASTPGSNVVMSFGASIYVTILGTEIISAEIEDVDIKRFHAPAAGVSPYYTVGVSIKNSGNVHLRPKIEVVLNNSRLDEDFPVGFTYGWPVFGTKTDEYSGNLNTAKLPEGRYSAAVTVTFPGIEYKTLERKMDFDVDKDGRVVKADKEG